MNDLPQEQLHMQGVDPLHGRRFRVRKRDGRVEEFNEARTLLALESAFKAHLGVGPEETLPMTVQADVKQCADRVVERVLGRAVKGEELEVERIQDAVEEQLMAEGHHDVARRYILYREERRRARVERELPGSSPPPAQPARTASAGRTNAAENKGETAERVLARERLRTIYEQALPKARRGEKLEDVQRRQFESYLNEGEYLRSVAPALLEFDCGSLALGLRPERDELFTAAGLKGLADLYLGRVEGQCIETPQYLWMKIAMGLALPEKGAREARALEFYEGLSRFRFVTSDSLLRRSGTPNPGLNFGQEGEPNNGTWLEPWHRDIWEFLARHRPGAETPGWKINKGLWLPDLFMHRVRQHGAWTLFDPAEAESLRQTHGAQFEARYLEWEQKAAQGALRFSRRVNAGDLWREILASLQQTGQPWLGFMDTVNLRSAQEGPLVRGGGAGGAVRLYGWPEERIACPCGAINLAAHVGEGGAGLDIALLQNTVTTAVRMLDNAVTLSSSPAGLDQRPIGLGVVGFAEALDRLRLLPGSAAAADFADWSMELVSYFAILASSELAGERGPYPGCADSKWSRGILPMDTLASLARARGDSLRINGNATLDWELVRERIREQGIRNCATTAVEPLSGPAFVVGLNSSPNGPEIDPRWLIECAARRQKWIDLGHTLDLPILEKDLGKISHLFMQAWEKGLKTTGQLILISVPPEETEDSQTLRQAEPPPELATVGG
jgi:ribonucleotide reductase alpha subunit